MSKQSSFKLTIVGLSIEGTNEEVRTAVEQIFLNDQPLLPEKSAKPVKRCPRCRHKAHGQICLNMESDHGCDCQYNSRVRSNQ